MPTSLPPIERLQTLANDDAWLVQRGRFIDVTFLIEVGATPYLVKVHNGRIEKLERGPFVLPRWTFALRAPEEAWAKFWAATPAPGFHDLIAMLKFRALRIEGDQHPFMANLRYFKDLLALLRAPAGGAR
jgi:hypothetical protein